MGKGSYEEVPVVCWLFADADEIMEKSRNSRKKAL
jgi:hypothetical protein